MEKLLIYAVANDGKVTPATKQWAGVQYDHNATTVVFDISEIDNADGIAWRIDFDSPEAGYDAGDVAEDVAIETVGRAIPDTMTRYGGDVQVTLVGSRNDMVVYSVPVTVYFTPSQRHEPSEGSVGINVSAAELAAQAAAQEAQDAQYEASLRAAEAAGSAEMALYYAEESKESAQAAAQSAADTQASLDGKMDKFGEVYLDDRDFYTMNIDHNMEATAEGVIEVISNNGSAVIINGITFPHNGCLSLPKDPVDEENAANKRYVDNAIDAARDYTSEVAELVLESAEKYTDDAIANIDVSGGGSSGWTTLVDELLDTDLEENKLSFSTGIGTDEFLRFGSYRLTIFLPMATVASKTIRAYFSNEDGDTPATGSANRILARTTPALTTDGFIHLGIDMVDKSMFISEWTLSIGKTATPSFYQRLLDVSYLGDVPYLRVSTDDQFKAGTRFVLEAM